MENKILGELESVDSESLKNNKFGFFLFLVKLLRCNELIYVPAQNNLKFLFPIIFILSKVFFFKVRYFVVGGWLTRFLEVHYMHRWMLRRVSSILVETDYLKTTLSKQCSLDNVQIFPNFRFREKSSSEFKSHQENSNKLSLVFLARVHPNKGVRDLFELDNFFNKQDCKSVNIDIYGPIEESFRKEFNSLLEKASNVQYKGVCEPELSSQLIKNYDALVFPTHWYTEGLPGTVVDACFAGIPIVSYRWQSGDEFINHNENGLLVDFKSVEDLIKKISLLVDDKELLSNLKRNASKHAYFYTYEFAKQRALEIFKGSL